MENKVHFKLHKVKKQWVTIAVSGLALGASLIGVGVSADEQAANQVTSASTPESVSQDPDLVVTETTVATTKADQGATNKASDTTATVTTDKQPVLKEDQASSTYNLSSGETRTATSTSETANTATDVNSQAPESVETAVVSGGHPGQGKAQRPGDRLGRPVGIRPAARSVGKSDAAGIFSTNALGAVLAGAVRQT